MKVYSRICIYIYILYIYIKYIYILIYIHVCVCVCVTSMIWYDYDYVCVCALSRTPKQACGYIIIVPPYFRRCPFFSPFRTHLCSLVKVAGFPNWAHQTTTLASYSSRKSDSVGKSRTAWRDLRSPWNNEWIVVIHYWRLFQISRIVIHSN